MQRKEQEIYGRTFRNLVLLDKHFQRPQHYKASLSNEDVVFSRQVAFALMYTKNKAILFILDIVTKINSAQFLKEMLCNTYGACSSLLDPHFTKVIHAKSVLIKKAGSHWYDGPTYDIKFEMTVKIQILNTIVRSYLVKDITIHCRGRSKRSSKNILDSTKSMLCV